MDIIQKYFPDLTPHQLEQLAKMGTVYKSWNEKINLISRKDIDFLYERHILHSMAIGKIIKFTAGTRIMDVGTGGGFPGIPLAVLFPQVRFHLIDSVGKKIKAVQSIIQELMLTNAETEQVRANEVKGKFDFIVCRAVTTLPEFVKWTWNKVSPLQHNALPNGILYLKGGDIDEEIRKYRNRSYVYLLSEIFTEPYFETKKLIYLSF